MAVIMQAALRHSPRLTSSPWLILQTRSNRRPFRRRTYATRPRNPYPFPSVTDPTPYQIFHLMPDASPADVKQRYYELVRLYHPDSAESRTREPDASRRHVQFSAITRAYARLQKRSEGELGLDADVAEGVVSPWTRAPSTMHQRRYDEPRFVDDRWKDRLLWGILGFSFVTIAAQTLLIRRRRFQDLADSLRAPGEPAPIRWDSPAASTSSDEDLLKLKRPEQ